MEDIFDRLGTLFKSMFQDSDDDSFGGTLHSTRSSGDPDLDAAYDELNDFLNKDMGESERRERDEMRNARARASAEARQGASGQGYGGANRGYGSAQAGSRAKAWPPTGLQNDYKVFDLPVGTKLPQVKSVYKKILMEFHPDRHAGNPEMLKKSTEYSAKVNAAYRRIEHYLETGAYEGA